NDGNGGVRTEDVIILIRANSPPQAVNDAASVKEDGGTNAIATGNLVANDPDLEGDPLSISAIRLGVVEGAGSTGVIVPTLGTANLFSDPGTGNTVVMARLQLLDPNQGRFEAGESAGITIINGDDSSSIVISGSWSRLNSYLLSPGFKLSINPGIRDAVGFSAALFQQGSSPSQLGAAISGSAIQRTVLPPGASTALSTYGSNALQGAYGKVLVFSNGSYAYYLDNSNLTVQALAVGETLSEAFTYTVSDGYTSTKAVLTLTITGSNDAPVITATDTNRVHQEDEVITPDRIHSSGILRFTDRDASNRSNTTVALSSYSISNGSLPSALQQQIASALAAGFNLNGDLVNMNSGTVGWDFSIDNTLLQGLRASDTVTATYTITVANTQAAGSGTGEESLTSTQSVVITLLGRNDQPLISVNTGLGGRDATTLMESGGTLQARGALSLNDADFGDSLSASVLSVEVEDSSGRIQLPLQTLKGMLNVVPLLQSNSQSHQLEWQFNSGANSFDALGRGESLLLRYRIEVRDGSGASNQHWVTVEIVGRNDAPVVDISGAGARVSSQLTETNAGLVDSGFFRTSDRDLNDQVSASVTSVTASGTTAGLVPTQSQLLAMLQVANTPVLSANHSSNDGLLKWSFNSGAEAFNYLGAGQTLNLTYTITIADGKGGSIDQTVVVTLIGTNDGPAISLASGDTATASLTETNTSLSTSGT
ncbi:MAG: hypothetical protein FJ070_10915, partial [Cyanobacteria bacterium K_DeepCast_150m_m2_101]|nr:hypothetical protein [Cyanobacteria bacterium K_DeepCast_150m_m2_101]